MQLSPTAPAPAYQPGQLVARLKDLRTNTPVIVRAGDELGDQAVFATRQDAFKAAYAGSLGADRGAMLVGRDTLESWWIQPALVEGPDAAVQPFHFETETGGRPIAPRGGTIPSLAAIIDGPALISPGA